MGKIMRNLPIVVILVLAGSLIESLFILPSHLAGRKHAVSGHRLTAKKEKIMSRLLKWVIKKPYAWSVDFCIRWRYATVALGIAVLLLSVGLWQGGWIKFTFFPKVEGDVLTCYITMPTGTPLKRTQEVVGHLEKTVREALAEADQRRPGDVPPLFEHSMALIGVQFGSRGGEMDRGAHLAQIWVQLLEGEQRDVSAAMLNNLWREKAGRIPDAESITYKSELHSAGNAIEVHLSLDDHDELVVAADELKAELDYP